MEYISAELFLKQDKEIQKVFIEWWKPVFGDLASFKGIAKHCLDTKEDFCFVNEYNEEREKDQYEDSYGIELYNMFCIGNDFSKYGFSFKSKFDIIPLFTEGQIRQFIEDKTKGKIDLYRAFEDEYTIIINNENLENIFQEDLLGKNVLKAYWKIALEVAKKQF